MEEKKKFDDKKQLYIIRRFAPGFVVVMFIFLWSLFIDATKIHWVGAAGGAFLALYLFLIRSAAEKRFPHRKG